MVSSTSPELPATLTPAGGLVSFELTGIIREQEGLRKRLWRLSVRSKTKDRGHHFIFPGLPRKLRRAHGH